MEANEQQVSVGECLVAVGTGETKDGYPFISLRGIDCDLKGMEPGLYFPTKLVERAKAPPVSKMTKAEIVQELVEKDGWLESAAETWSVPQLRVFLRDNRRER